MNAPTYRAMIVLKPVQEVSQEQKPLFTGNQMLFAWIILINLYLISSLCT